MCTVVFRHRHFMYDYKVILQIFEISPKSEGPVHFYLVFIPTRLNIKTGLVNTAV